MLTILSFFSFMRIQIKWEAMRWLSALAFDSSFSIYPSKHWNNISSNELFLPPKHKDPSCHSEQHVLHSWLPTL